ncbi:MAG: MbcA/ParS/Xre antitoxin family protein [Microvirga sp.]|nr:MbcA/ParS/Xre antitoxin family protein [Microvirga sp.]
MAKDRQGELIELATRVLGSREEEALWMRAPQIGLNGAIPEALIVDPEGYEQVLALLIRMERGVYS